MECRNVSENKRANPDINSVQEKLILKSKTFNSNKCAVINPRHLIKFELITSFLRNLYVLEFKARHCMLQLLSDLYNTVISSNEDSIV